MLQVEVVIVFTVEDTKHGALSAMATQHGELEPVVGHEHATAHG